MAQAAHHVFDFATYVMLERDSTVKHEYLRGQVWAMHRCAPAHARIAGNVLALLGTQLRDKKCSAFTSDLRIRVQATDLATYPDVSVVCGSLVLDPEDPKGHTVVNPRVVVEVLSPSTEAYDRGEKLAHYKQIPELAEIVLVAHDRREIEVVRREADGTWSTHVWRDGACARVESIACDLLLAEVYRDPLG